jgi:hypothetical protein
MDGDELSLEHATSDAHAHGRGLDRLDATLEPDSATVTRTGSSMCADVLTKRTTLVEALRLIALIEHRTDTANTALLLCAALSSPLDQIEDVLGRLNEVISLGVRDRSAVDVHEQWDVLYVIDESLQRAYR